jgi:dsDNA-specific endonuclease/ATPase MutS2
MVKKKLNMSVFSTLVQQINSEPSSSAEYHLIDNEYFAAFNSLNDIQEFHNKLTENQSINSEEDTELQSEHDMDMKTFAQQYLIDLPEPIITEKRQRRNIKDLPQSSNFIFMSDDDNGNIFDSLKEKKSSSRSKRIAYEDMSSILLTLDIKQKRKKNSEPTIAIELAEPSIIKNEPIEQEQVREFYLLKKKNSFKYFSLLLHMLSKQKTNQLN